MIRHVVLLLKSAAIFLALCFCAGHLSLILGPLILGSALQRSYVEGNVPELAQFDSLLERDLESYFSKDGQMPSVQYDFLREGPTQTGLSFPKYYLWVSVSDQWNEVNSGAVRVKAIDKSEFHVTDFVSAQDARTHPDQLEDIFPSPVAAKIRERLHVNGGRS